MQTALVMMVIQSCASVDLFPPSDPAESYKNEHFIICYLIFPVSTRITCTHFSL